MKSINRHKRIVFQFSGGKDSIACLLLLKDYLHKITVMWTNTGAAFPETIEQMEKVKQICPNFIEVNGHQPEQIEANGYPVDVLPVRNHLQSQYLTQQKRLPLQGFLGCCAANMMSPMHEATKNLGATLIIRGQKLTDHHKSPVRSGDVIDGIEYLFPIESLTDDQVMSLIKDSELLPKHYKDARTSLDCWSCTAYLEENQWKLPYLMAHHPEKGREVKKRLIMIRNEIMSDLKFMEVCND